MSAVLLGLVVLTGWAADIDALRRTFPRLVAVNPMAALVFVLAGASLRLQFAAPAVATGRRLGRLCAATVLGAGVVTLASYAFGWSPGPDQVLFAEKLLRDDPSPPNRMALNAAVNFVFIGLALLLLDVGSARGKRLSEALTLAAAFVSLHALVGHAYGVRWSYGAATFTTMAPLSAAAFLLLALGVLATRPQRGLMAIVTGDSPGGALARRLLPTMVLTLLLLGWLCLEGESRGIYDAALGFSLYTIANIAIFAALVVWGARSLLIADNARKRVEADRQRFFTLSRDLLCIAGFDGYLKEVNPAWESALGFTREELLGRPFLDFVHPDDRADALTQAQKAEVGVPNLSYENRYQCADGTYRWLLWSATPIPDEGLIYATARDITERKLMEAALMSSRDVLEARVQERTAALLESEERARLIVDTALDAVVTMDSDWTITGWNSRAERMFGWPREEALGRKLDATIIPRRFREAHRRGLRNFLAKGDALALNARIEIAAVDRHEREFPVELAIAPVQRRGQWSFSAFARDISERKRSERAVRESEEKVRQANLELERRVQERTAQLETANKELEAFSYSVSHDLRAPLRHVQGYVEMLAAALAGQLPDKARRYLNVITEASVEMGRLIDDLLAFSRMARGELQERRVDVGELVHDIVRGMEMDTRDRRITWNFGPLPAVVGDAAMIKQVLANLIGNAVKYTRGRDPAVIELGCAGEHEGRVLLFVRDNGAGFDMQYVHKLFGVFQRLHRTEEFEGNGIGLASVRRIVARHGGRVWAEGVPDEGAVFYFTLKAVAPASAGNHEREARTA
jgi:PAS domain S-box-containing protein